MVRFTNPIKNCFTGIAFQNNTKLKLDLRNSE